MAVQTRPDVYYLPAYVALERWLLAKRVAVLSPAGPEGPRRLAAAGAARVLVLGATFEPSPRVEVWRGPLPSSLQLPLRDGSVDALLCIEAHAVLGPEGRAALVQEARRVLRASGVLVIWSDGRAETEAELRLGFPQVLALAQQRWSGVRFAPVAEPSAGVRLAEDLLPGPIAAGPVLLLASRGELSPLLAEGVLVPTAEEPIAATVAVDRAAFVPAEPAVPVAVVSVAVESSAVAVPDVLVAAALAGPAVAVDEAVAAREAAVAAREAAVAASEAFAASAAASASEAVAAREAAVAEREAVAASEAVAREAAVVAREAAVAAREADAASEALAREAAVAAREAAIAAREAVTAREAVAASEAPREAAVAAEREVSRVLPRSEPASPAAAIPQPPTTRLLTSLPVRSPVPSLGPIDDSDVLAALFDAPIVSPPAPVLSGPAPVLSDGPTSSPELAALREQLAGLQAEREGLRQQAVTLAEALTQAQTEVIDVRSELHEMRGRAGQQSRGVQHPEQVAEEASPTKSESETIGLHDSSMITRVLVDEVAPMVAPEAPRPSADVALDRDRLREELTRRTADMQALETRLWESEEEVQKERLENVRLVTDVDRLREQVDRSRIAEHERVQELERLGHELRRLELSYAELQGLLVTSEQRVQELEASVEGEEHPPDIEMLREQVRELGAQRDQAQALERAANELARRRERELAEAGRTIRELRRNVEEHASISANLRGEIAVIQVEVEQYQASVPRLQERLRDQQQKTLEREEEAAELQRRLESAVSEQQHLRQRLRRHRQETEGLAAVRDALEVDLYRLRGELEARRKVVEQLQRLVALGTGDGRAAGDAGAELQGLRAMLAEQASLHAEQLAQAEQQQRQSAESERARLKRTQLEAAIRGEEQEFLLYQLDTAEQRIWEMTDATDRSAARLAAGLAQLEKQKEQYEDLIDQLEVSRNLLAEAQGQIVELERQLANERAKLARLTLEPGVRIDVEEEEGPDTGAFDILMDDPGGRDEDSDSDASGEVAPEIHTDPNAPDRLAGIDFDDDDDEESLAVRLAGTSFTGAFEIANVQIDLDDEDDDDVSEIGRVVLPSDVKVQIDFDDDDEDDEPVPAPAPAPAARAPARPPSRPAPAGPKLLRTLPFLDDDEDVFSIDTDAIELATPTPAAPVADRPGFDQKFAEHSNSRIVIEVLDDEAWPDEQDLELDGDGEVDAAKKP